MLQAIQVLTLILVAIAMALSLAHALELPGKMRLARQTYIATQPIYYPGFTVGGAIGEGGGMIAALVLLFLLPAGSPEFWLAFAAFVALLAMHGVYWVLTHPVNKVWLRGTKLDRAGEGFFAFDPLTRPRIRGAHQPISWTVLRDRWEYSHVIRAALALLALILLAIAVTR